jgi:hypothetical protein
MDEQEALKISQKAAQFYEDGSFKKSMSYYKKALEIFHILKNVGAEAGIFLYMGDIYLETKDFKSAEEQYLMALKNYKKLKDKIGEGYALTGLGVLSEKKGAYEESRSHYRKATKKFKKAGDHEREAIVTSLIAGTFETQEAWEDALMEYKESFNIFRKNENREEEQVCKSRIRTLKSNRKKHKASKWKIVIVIIYLIALILAEAVTNYYKIEIGLAMHVCILFALLLHSSLESSSNFANLLRSMMVLPLIRIIGLSIPMMQIGTLYWFLIIVIPLFAASYNIIKAQGLGKKNVGLVVGKIPVQILIASTGILLGTIEYFILKPKPLIPVFNLEMVLFAGIILLVATGFAEELLFRGIIQKNAENVFGKLSGLLYTALIFTTMHIGWKSFPDLIFVFCVAMFYGYAFQKTRSLSGVTLSHGLSNTFLFIVVPFILM